MPVSRLDDIVAPAGGVARLDEIVEVVRPVRGFKTELRAARPRAWHERIVDMFRDSTGSFLVSPKPDPDLAVFDKANVPVAKQPLVKFSALAGADTEAKSIQEGALRGVLEAADTWVSPEGVAVMGGLGKLRKLKGIGRAAVGAIGGGFDADMIVQAVREVPEAKRLWAEGHKGEAARVAVRSLLVAGGGLYGAGRLGHEAARQTPLAERPLSQGERAEVEARFRATSNKKLKREAGEYPAPVEAVAREIVAERKARTVPAPVARLDDIVEVVPPPPRMNRDARRKALAEGIPETGAAEPYETLIDARLEEIARELGFEYGKLGEADRAVVRALRDQGERSAVSGQQSAVSGQRRELAANPDSVAELAGTSRAAERERPLDAILRAEGGSAGTLTPSEQAALRKAVPPWMERAARVGGADNPELIGAAASEYLAAGEATAGGVRSELRRLGYSGEFADRAVAAAKREAQRAEGPEGPLAPEYAGDEAAATAWLRARGRGEVPAALADRAVGRLDLTSGRNAATAQPEDGPHGLRHVEEGHPSMVGKMQAALDAAVTRKQQGNKITAVGPAGGITIGLSRKGRPKSFVVTAVEPKAGIEAPAEGEIGGVPQAHGRGGGTTQPPTGAANTSMPGEPAASNSTGGLFDAIERVETDAKKRIEQRWKDAGTKLSAGAGLAAEQLADYAVVGAAKIAKGAIKFGDWSRVMLAEYGEAIRPYLGKIWMKAQALAKQQEAGGAGRPPEAVGKTAAAPSPQPGDARPARAAVAATVDDPARPVASPSYDTTKAKILEKVSPEVREGMAARLADWETRNPERRAVTFAEVVEEARGLDAKIVAELDMRKLRAGETLDPAVRFAARETLAGLEQEIRARDQQLDSKTELDPEARERVLRQREELEKDARRLIDVLIPTRSQDGRNLAYHRIMAERSFDITYWLSRAKRAMAIPEDVALPADVEQGLREILREGEAAEQRAISRRRQREAATPEAASHPGPRRQRDRRTVDAEGRPLPSAEERMARAKERELERIAAETEGRKTERAPSKWELTPEERALVDADPEVRAARTKLARRVMRLERTGLADAITAFRRAGLLTGVKTHLRNFGGNLSFQVLEEVSRAPAAVVDAALALFTGRRTVQGPSVRAVARASRQGATRGVREARQILREGATDEQLAQLDLVQEINTGSRAFDGAVNLVFRSMAASDRLFKVYAFERSLQEQMRLAQVDKPTEAMRVKAWEDALYATFNNDNIAAEVWSQAKAAARRKGAAGRALASGMDLAVPFARTPANILARLADYTPAGALPRAAFAIGRALRAKGWTAEQQRAFSQALGRGMAGTALLYLGWWLGEQGLLTGARDEDERQRNRDEAAGRMAGSLRVGGTWQRIDALAPAGNLLVLGATLGRDWLERGDVTAGLAGAAKTVLEQPMLSGLTDVGEAVRNPARSGRRLAGSMAGSFVPTIVADAAGAADTVRRETRDATLAGTIGKHLAVRVPGLRNTLPERVDVFGEAQPQRLSSAVNPGIGSEAKEASDAVLRELVAADAGIGSRERRPGESEGEFRERLRSEGREIRARLGWLFQSRGYREADAEERRELIREQIGKARRKKRQE